MPEARLNWTMAARPGLWEQPRCLRGLLAACDVQARRPGPLAELVNPLDDHRDRCAQAGRRLRTAAATGQLSTGSRVRGRHAGGLQAARAARVQALVGAALAGMRDRQDSSMFDHCTAAQRGRALSRLVTAGERTVGPLPRRSGGRKCRRCLSAPVSVDNERDGRARRAPAGSPRCDVARGASRHEWHRAAPTGPGGRQVAVPPCPAVPAAREHEEVR